MNTYNLLKRKQKKFVLLSFLLSMLSGVLLGCGWPTNGNPLYLFVSFVPLLYLENFLEGSFLSVFVFSYFSFLTWNGIATWWLYYSQHSNGSFALEAYCIPIFFNAFFMSIVFSFSSWIKKYSECRKIGYAFFIFFWIVLEKIHLEWELSWPWLNLGNGFANRIEWIQWYEYTGTLGGTLWIWIVNIILSVAIIEYDENRNIIVFYKKIFTSLMIIFSLILISSILYMKYGTQQSNKYIEVLVLQPNIDPYHQKYQTSTEQCVYDFQNLMDQNISKKSMIIVAPETAFPGYGYKIPTKDLEGDRLIHFFREYLRKKSPKTVFLTGLELFEIYDRKDKSDTSTKFFFGLNESEKWIDLFNSIVQIASESPMNNYHHKSKLVPAVETFPYKKIFYPILGNILLDFGGEVMELGKANNISVFQHPYCKVKIAPIICYESVFGEYVSKFFKKNAELMVIITNDGWWGNTQGHKQHCYYSRLRAIENRKWIARSANTGISCFINERGDIISYVPYGKKGVIREQVALNKKKTFYIQHGDYIAKISLLFVINIFSYVVVNNIFKFFEKILRYNQRYLKI